MFMMESASWRKKVISTRSGGVGNRKFEKEEGSVGIVRIVVGMVHMYREEAHGAGSLGCWQLR